MLEIIQIEKPAVSFDMRENPNAERDYGRWKAEAYAKLGYTGSGYVFSGEGPWDFTWYQESLYSRRVLDWRGESSYSHFSLEWSPDVTVEKANPSVLCECGGVAFELRIADYAVAARCSACGKEATVYDG